jgi:hypothetical protein
MRHPCRAQVMIALNGQKLGVGRRRLRAPSVIESAHHFVPVRNRRQADDGPHVVRVRPMQQRGSGANRGGGALTNEGHRVALFTVGQSPSGCSWTIHQLTMIC